MMIREKWQELSSLSILEAALLKHGIDPDHHEEKCDSEPGYEEYFGSHIISDQVDITINALFDAVRSKVIDEVSRSPRIDGSVGAADVRILKSHYLRWLNEHGCPAILSAFSYKDQTSDETTTSITPAGDQNDLAGSTEENESAIEQSPAQPWTETGLGKRERQIRIIEFLVGKFQFKCLSIPDGGKMKIGKECKESYTQFFGVGDDPFKEAWQEAVKQCRIRMEKHEQYSRE